MKTEKRELPRRPLIMPSIALIIGILAEERFCQIYFITEHPILGLIPVIGCFCFMYMAKMEKNRNICMIFLLIGMLCISINIYILDWRVDLTNVDPGVVVGRIVRIDKFEERTEVVLDSASIQVAEGKDGAYIKENTADEERDNRNTRISGRVMVRLYAEQGELVTWEDLGKEVEMVLRLEKPMSAGNPGNFDYKKYLLGRGISFLGTFKGVSIKTLDTNAGLKYRLISWIIRSREGFLRSFFIDEDARHLAGGILFGLSGNISDEVRGAYMEGGAGHILAVSGLHIGILYSICKAIEKRVGIRSNIIKKMIIITIFIIYGTASLWSVSVTRAILLILIKEVSDNLNYRFDHMSVLALISDVMLVYRPYLVFSTGFQMSFFAILGICLLRPKIAFLMKRVFNRYIAEEDKMRELESALSTMLSVQLIMIPYTVCVHNRFSALAIINNWFMIALAGIYVPLGAGSFLYSLPTWNMQIGFTWIENYVGSALSYLGRIMTEVNLAFLLDGKSVISAVSPRVYILVGVMGLVFYIASESFKLEHGRNQKIARFKAFRIAICSVLLSALFSFNPLALADEIFLDVGQGDALHLAWEEANILIDGGGNSNFNVGDRTLRPYFLHTGIGNLSLALSTHQHMDHFKGIEELNEVYPIQRIVTHGKAGDRIILDDNHYIDILWPIPGYENSDDENYFSRIYKVYDRGITTLVTGDITEEGERALISYYGAERLKSHILKIAHHGSRFSTCQEFIDAVSPIIAIISVGDNNYGHPAPSVIEKLERSGIIVYRTDRDGAIGIIVGKNRFWVCGNRRNMRIEEYSAN